MNVLVSAATIRNNLMMHGKGEYSLEAINYVAQNVCGYKLKKIGGLRGYHKSVISAIQRHFKELNEYEYHMQEIEVQRANKRPNRASNDGTYDPNRFIEPSGRKDYEWESYERAKNLDGIITEVVKKILNTL